MKITISKKDLNEAIMGLSKVATKKPAVPILSTIKISSNKGGVRITATNLDESLTYIKDDKPSPVYSFLINIQDLKDYLFKTTSAQKYDFSIIDEGSVKITADANINLEKDFKTIPVDKFPEAPTAKRKSKISAQVFENIKQAIPSASKDDTRTVIKNVLLESESVVATEGKELVQLKCNTGINEKVMLPITKVLSSGMLTKNDGTISIDKFNGSQYCSFATANWQYSIKTAAGIYPDYKQVIPKTTSRSIEISTNDIEYLLKAIPLLESTSVHKSIYLYANKNKIAILSENLISSVLQATGIYRCEDNKEPFAIAMNKGFLLRAFKLGFNKFNFGVGYSPVLATTENSNSQMVFMPLKGSLDVKKIEEKMNKKASQYRYTEPSKTTHISRLKQAESLTKRGKNEKVANNRNKKETPKSINKANIKEENKMSETVSKIRTRVFQVTGNPNINSIDSILEDITTIKIKAREVIESATALSKKVKEVQKNKKVREREFKNTRELLVKLQKVSGF